MRTTTSKASITGKTRRAPVASTLAAVCLALPMSGLLGGMAFATDGDTAALKAASDHGNSAAAAAHPAKETSAADTATPDRGNSADAKADAAEKKADKPEPKPAGFIGPVVPKSQNAAPVAQPTPYVNQGGVTTGSNTTSYETVGDHKGSTFTGVGGGQPSGNIKSPQPYSNADKNNTGANDTSASNPYKSTRDGSPSLNGNGGGKQVGQPCAGCVGKADNKNPPGQAPNATDGNAGYECDRNHGIGRSNPAHTACTRSTPTPTPTPSPSCTPTAANDHCGTDVPDCKGKKGGHAKASDCKPTVFCPGTTTPMPANGKCDSDEVDKKVTLCHATGSATNPFVTITVSINSVIKGHGHGDHDADIIPAFAYGNGQHYPGKNAGKSCSLPPVVCQPGTSMVNGTCTPPPPVTVCQPGTTMVNGTCRPPLVTVCPIGMIVSGTGCATQFQGGSGNPATTPVTPTVITVGGQGTTAVVVPLGPVPATPAEPSALPFTGTNTLRLVGLAGLLLLVGVGLVLAARRPAGDAV